MEISDLTIFQEVIKSGGITAAANRLYRVPSNISTRIQQLEEDIGVALFIRKGKRLILSDEGKTLSSYSEKILSLSAQAKQAVLNSEDHGWLKLGSIESVSTTVVPRILNKYHRTYPEVSIQIKSGPSLELLKILESEEIDAAIVSINKLPKQFDSKILFTEELVLVSEASAQLVTVPGEIATHTFLCFRKGCTYRKVLEDWLDSKKEHPGKVIELTSYYSILSCVAVGMGIAIMPKDVLDSFPNKKLLKAYTLQHPFKNLQVQIAWRKDFLSKKVQALIRQID